MAFLEELFILKIYLVNLFLSTTYNLDLSISAYLFSTNYYVPSSVHGDDESNSNKKMFLLLKNSVLRTHNT